MSEPTNLARSRWLLPAAAGVCLGVSIWLLAAEAARPGASPPADLRTAASADIAAAAAGGAGESAAAAPLRRLPADLSTAPGLVGRLLQDGEPLAGAEVRTDDDSDSRRCTTGDDGAFCLPDCRGSIHLVITGSTVPPGFTFGPVDVAKGERYDVGDVLVPRGAAVTGCVLDEQGRPLAGVAVFAGSADADLYPFEPGAEATCPSAVTGADGRFRLAGLLPGAILVAADHPDREPSDYPRDAAVTVGSGECADTGELVLALAAPLSGVVCDGRGQPVAGARVMPGGGDCHYLHPARAVRTGADGGFLLRGFGGCEDLTIEAEGFETLTCERVDQASRPFVARLRPALVLAGSVPGSRGQPGCVRVQVDADARRDLPGWVHGILCLSQPIGADGSFRIVGLPAGKWRVRAWVPAVGSSDFVACELPQQQPLRLDLEPARELVVLTVDDLDRPLAGAEVSLWHSEDELDLAAASLPRSGREAVTDAGGRAVLRLSSPRKLWIRGAADGHCSERIEVDPRAGAEVVTLRLCRAGWLCGRVAAADLRARVHLRVSCWRLDQDDGSSFLVDGRGSFRSGPLRPGRYSLTLVVGDATEPSSWWHPVPRPLPLLGDRVRVGEQLQVEIVAGRDTAVELPAPPVGELHGRVLASGAPVASAVVFARQGEGEAEPYLLPAQLETRDDRFFCRTDADGRFCFLAPEGGSFQLRARHAQGASWSEPVVVRVPSPGASAQCEIRLDAASIRGSFDPRALPPAERGALRVHLYRLQDAAEDPRQHLWTEDGSKYLEDTVPQVQPDRSSAFAFACLPAGGWVVRLATQRGILLQRVVHTAADGEVDLGLLQPETGVVPRLRCGLGEHAGVQLLQLVDGRALFLRVVDNCAGKGFDWGPLLPGRYRLRATAMREISSWHGSRSWSWWRPGKPIGEPVEVELHADGSCTPAVVWPDGIRQ